MAASSRTTNILLVLVLAIGVGIVAMLATVARGGPLDPPNAPGSTDSVRSPGTPIASAPFTISQPGHYYLTRDLSVPGGQIAMTINASNVSLDLGGFTIGGNDAVGSYGIYIAGTQSDIRITDGTVRDFQFGVDAGDDTRVQLDGVNAVSNVRGFQLGTNDLVTNCLAEANTETGIYIPGSGTTVRDCEVMVNSGDGISMAGSANLVEGSRVDGQVTSIRVTQAGSVNVIRGNLVSSMVLAQNGGAVVVDNVCWSSAISNATGNTTAAPDHTNVLC